MSGNEVTLVFVFRGTAISDIFYWGNIERAWVFQSFLGGTVCPQTKDIGDKVGSQNSGVQAYADRTYTTGYLKMNDQQITPYHRTYHCTLKKSPEE